MTASVLVRPAGVEDAAAIAVVNLASWEAAYRGVVADAWLDRQTLEGRTARWTELLGDGATVLVTGSRPGEVVGYCAMSLPARDDDLGPEVAEIAAIYVAPTAFRGGAGTALMTRALEVAAAAAYREMILWVLAVNDRARAFYAARGFTTDGAVKWLDDFQAEEIRLRRAV